MWALALVACGAKPQPQTQAPVVTEAQAAASRQACMFGAGAMARDTLASEAPVGDQIPIDHVVLIMQENRSFDHYFSQLPGGQADVAPADATNPDADGNPVARFHQTQYCFNDTSHSWGNSHREFDDGKNDGFVQANEPSGERAMGYYDASDLPFYYALAQAFAISDRHFCSLLGPTWPNRMFSLAATSFGITSNTVPPDSDAAGNPYQNIFLELNAANVSWKVYSEGVASPVMFAQTFADNEPHFVGADAFWTDAAAGSLPSVSWVEPKFGSYGGGADEHPPADMQLGQAFVAKVVNALMSSPSWPKTALFLTYDENGGLYDHVPPPPACAPDDVQPFQYSNGMQVPAMYAFDRYGFRVPLLVVSPYAKRGYVSHHVSDHTSILRFLEARFGMPAMTRRDANADPLYDMFDFAHPNLDKPSLPAAAIEPTEQTRCATAYPPKSGDSSLF